MSIAKRLVIKAGTSYDGDFKIIPVNGQFIDIQSPIGLFSIKVDIKNFDGAKPHISNSFYNLDDSKHLDGSKGEAYKIDDEPFVNPNIRIEYRFTPNKNIKGDTLIFGNDFTYPIRDFMPTSLLQTGLKFFTWFISKTVKGDVYNDKPFLYGLALNSFTYISEAEKAKDTKFLGVNKSADFNFVEKLGESGEIPGKSLDRKKYFNNVSHAKKFEFKKDVPYILQFDTNFLKMSDSKYAVLIPTFGNKTFDIHVLQYANETLNNFNWIVKIDGYEGVGFGELGLVLNFALADEPEDRKLSESNTDREIDDLKEGSVQQDVDMNIDSVE